MRIALDLSLTAKAGGNPAFRQDGPTLDLVFAGPVSDLLTTGPTLDLNFTSQTYQVGVQYVVWDNDRNASLPAAIAVSSIVIPPPTSIATAAFALNANGTFASTPAGTSGAWLIGSGLNSAYEARLTVVSGSFSGAATNVWLPLDISRSWSVTQSGFGDKEAQGTLQIRNAANGAVLTSSLLELYASVEI